MIVLEYGDIRKYTCPCCDSKLGYTNNDIYIYKRILRP